VELFREEQAFRRWWLVLIIGGVAALIWWGFVRQIILGEPWGDDPAPDWMMVIVWLVVGIGLPFFFFGYMRLIVTVSSDAVIVNFRPFTRRVLPLTDIVAFEARDYRPIREYGGWGIRGYGNRRAYNVSGDRGVDLKLIDDREVMIGSQRADELERAISEAHRA
jgi:hypothetical protein